MHKELLEKYRNIYMDEKRQLEEEIVKSDLKCSSLRNK